VALIDVMRREALAMDLGGRDLALIEVSDALRLLVWFNLIGAMFLPFGMAGADAGPIAWAVGIITWLIRTLLAATLLALLHSGLGRIGLVRAAQVLGVAVLFGLLATLFLLADMGAA
jgi:formate hydrogenlyase subunit 4